MFERDAIHSRGKALEDEFFRRVDEKLMEDMRRAAVRDATREQLAKVSGLKDETVLDHMVDAGFEPTTLTALSLVPCVFVAWADGNVTEKERQAVVETALDQGIEEYPSAMQMLQQWLEKHPPRPLWQLWKEYAEAVQSSFPSDVADRLRDDIVQQATEVAKASGGALGFGKISANEQKLLDEIRATLNRDS